jgi:hypothetical protein
MLMFKGFTAELSIPKLLIRGLLILAALSGFSQSVQAQDGMTALREARPLFPATGVWWTNADGAGRWGVQIELQESAAFPDGLLTAAVFSYEADDLSRQAWYVVNQAYNFNPQWRDDGYIGRLQLSLRRTANGTCLECEDGAQAGESVDSEVGDVEITFHSSTNATLRVGSVNHELVKAEFGTTSNNTSRTYWERPFEFIMQVESEGITDTFGRGLIMRAQATPEFIRANEGILGIDGWDLYEAVVPAELFDNSDTGTMRVATQAELELFVHPVLNRYLLVVDAFSNAGTLLSVGTTLELFPTSRYVIEGRALNTFILFGDLLRSGTGQSLMISTPSMRGGDGSELSFPR